jgi:hypothetical protein
MKRNGITKTKQKNNKKQQQKQKTNKTNISETNTCLVWSNKPRPKSSTPQLFETTVKFVDPLSLNAAVFNVYCSWFDFLFFFFFFIFVSKNWKGISYKRLTN